MANKNLNLNQIYEEIPEQRNAVKQKSAPSEADDTVDTTIQRCKLAVKQKRWDEASSIINELIRECPHLTTGYVVQASIALAQKDYEKASDALNKAIALSPDDPELHNKLGVSYRHLGKHFKAQNTFRKALALAPGNLNACINLAELARFQGKGNEAMQYYLQAVKYHPNNVDLWMELGHLAAERNDLENTRIAFQSVLALNPSRHQDVQNVLKKLQSRQRKNRNLNQSLCDSYLRCPACRKDKTLKLCDNVNTILCTHCHNEYKMNRGIPGLMHKDEIKFHSSGFLGIESFEKKADNPFRVSERRFYHFIISEIIYGMVALYFLFKFGPQELFKTRFLRPKWCDEVNRALYYGWTNYFNLILKSGEIASFNKMKKYISKPSLEIGCGSCETTNMIFRDRLDSVTFGCEFFMNNYYSSPSEMYKLIKHYIGGSIKSLPIVSSVFSSIYMVHIIDHIADTGIWFKEINRILKPGGYLVISGYSKNTFEHFPGVKLRNILSKKWAEKFKLKRATQENPYRGGIPLKTENEFYSTGMNMLSLEEWKELARSCGFELVDHTFFAKSYFSFFMDLEYRGYFPSLFFNEIIYSAISKLIENEKASTVSEKDSTNVVLVFKKVQKLD